MWKIVVVLVVLSVKCYINLSVCVCVCVCAQIFHKPLLECELLTEKEVAMIFVNWKELIMCNIKLLK